MRNSAAPKQLWLSCGVSNKHTWRSIAAGATLALVLVTLWLTYAFVGRPWESHCAFPRTEGRFANQNVYEACAVHHSVTFAFLILCCASAVNLFWRPVDLRPVGVAVGLVVVAQVAAQANAPPFVSSGTVSYGSCGYVDSQSFLHADTTIAGADTVQELLLLCNHSDTYVHLWKAWLKPAYRVSAATCDATENSWTLGDRLAGGPLQSWSFLLNVIEAALYLQKEDLWVQATDAERNAVIPGCALAFQQALCHVVVPICTPSCVVNQNTPICELVVPACTTANGAFVGDGLLSVVLNPNNWGLISAFLFARDVHPDNFRVLAYTVGYCGSPHITLEGAAAGATQFDCQTSQYQASWGWTPNPSGSSIGLDVSKPPTVSTLMIRDSSATAPTLYNTSGNCWPEKRKDQEEQANHGAMRNSLAGFVMVVTLGLSLLTPLWLMVGPAMTSENFRCLCKRRAAARRATGAAAAPRDVTFSSSGSLAARSANVDANANAANANPAVAATLTPGIIWHMVSWRDWWDAVGTDTLLFSVLIGFVSVMSFVTAYIQQRIWTALFFDIMGLSAAYLAVKWPVWYSHVTPVGNGGVGPLTRLKRFIGIDRYSFGKPGFMKYVLCSELIEWTGQLYNIVTLPADTDWSLTVALSAVVSCSMMGSGLVLGLVPAKWVQEAVVIWDTLFDFAYLFVTYRVRVIRDMELATFVVVAPPLVLGLMRARGVVNETEGPRWHRAVYGTTPSSVVEKEQESMHSVQLRGPNDLLAHGVGVGVEDTEVDSPSAHTSSSGGQWRLQGCGLHILQAVGFVLGAALLVNVVVRTLRQRGECQRLVGPVIWKAQHPQALFSNGFFRDTSCGFQHVSSLEVHDQSLTSTAVIEEYYTAVEYLDVSGSGLTRIESSFITALSKLVHLDLRKNELTHVAMNLFSSALLSLPTSSLLLSDNPFATRADVRGVNISHLPSLFVSSLAETLVHLVASHNRFSGEVPVNELLKFQMLQTADLSFNSMSDWPSSFDSAAFQHLQMFNLSHNQLSNVAGLLTSDPGVHWPFDVARTATLDISYNAFHAMDVSEFDFRGTLLVDHNPSPRWRYLEPLFGNLHGFTNVAALQVNLSAVQVFCCGFESLPRAFYTSPFAGSVQEMSLYGNNFVVPPWGIQNLTGLVTLRIGGDRELTAIGPSQVTSEWTITTLELVDNEKLSKLAGVSNMTRLEELVVHNGDAVAFLPKLSGQLRTLSMQKLHSLTSVDASLFQANLEYVQIEDCQLTSVPASLGMATRLKRLELNRNHLLAVPIGIGQCTSLELLYLHGNALLSVVPSLWNLTRLKTLYVYDCNLSSTPVIAPAVLSFNARENQLRSVDSTVFQPNIQVVQLQDNLLSSLPETLPTATSLMELHVQRNRFSSLALIPLANLTSLQLLHVHQMPGLSAMPTDLSSLTKLSSLYMYECNLTKLPRMPSSVKTLKAFKNRISLLDDSIFHPFLETLEIEDNALSSLPAALVSATRLRRLELQRNQLSSVPTTLGQCTSLRVLLLHGNPLVAPLPAELDRLVSLTTLWIDAVLGLDALPPGLRQRHAAGQLKVSLRP